MFIYLEPVVVACRVQFFAPRNFYPFSILFEIQILSKIEANCSKQAGKKDKFKDKKADCRQRAEAIACPFNADNQARIKRIILLN